MLKWLGSLLDDTDEENDDGFWNLPPWYGVVISLAFWIFTYYFVCCIFQNKSPEWCIRILALFHGLGATIRGLPECVTDSGEWIFHYPDEESTRTQMIILIISMGYFVFDLGWCMAYETETRLMILHHVYSCVALYRMLVTEVGGGQSACGLATMEITNPFLQLRWFLRSEGYYNTFVFKFTEITFIILFLLVRIIFGTYFMGVIISNSCGLLEQKLFATLVYILSWLIYANIVKFVYIKYIQNNLEQASNLEQ